MAGQRLASLTAGEEEDEFQVSPRSARARSGPSSLSLALHAILGESDECLTASSQIASSGDISSAELRAAAATNKTGLLSHTFSEANIVSGSTSSDISSIALLSAAATTTKETGLRHTFTEASIVSGSTSSDISSTALLSAAAATKRQRRSEETTPPPIGPGGASSKVSSLSLSGVLSDTTGCVHTHYV